MNKCLISHLCLFRKCFGLEMYAKAKCSVSIYNKLLHSFVVSVSLPICKNEVIRKVISTAAVKMTMVSTIRSPF